MTASFVLEELKKIHHNKTHLLRIFIIYINHKAN